jgi:hypothetical protein
VWRSYGTPAHVDDVEFEVEKLKKLPKERKDLRLDGQNMGGGVGIRPIGRRVPALYPAVVSSNRGGTTVNVEDRKIQTPRRSSDAALLRSRDTNSGAVAAWVFVVGATCTRFISSETSKARGLVRSVLHGSWVSQDDISESEVTAAELVDSFFSRIKSLNLAPSAEED